MKLSKESMQYLKLNRVLLLFFACSTCFVHTQSHQQKLMLILLDGIRYNYEMRDLKGFQNLFHIGATSDYMESAFPTISFTNYYSIATGLNPESHGILGNQVWDEERKALFYNRTTNSSYESMFQSFWWDDGEPIWITAERNGLKSHVYYWVGCEAVIRGLKPSYCARYDHEIKPISVLHNSIENGLKALQNNSADFVGIYYEDVDHTGHKYGPESSQRRNALFEIDKEMQYLTKQIEVMNLTNILNVMIVSDHGMTNVSTSKVINLTINRNDYKFILQNGPVISLWPKDNLLDKTYMELKNINSNNMNVYKKENIPSRWYYKNNKRVAPLLVVANLGYTIILPGNSYPAFADNVTMKGYHSYDNKEPEMYAFYVGFGPSLRKDTILPPFPNVDLYNAMCEILNIVPSPNNGSSTFDGLIQTSKAVKHSLMPILYVIIWCVLSTSGATIIICFTNYIRNKLRVRKYKSLHEHNSYNVDLDFQDEDALFVRNT